MATRLRIGRRVVTAGALTLLLGLGITTDERWTSEAGLAALILLSVATTLAAAECLARTRHGHRMKSALHHALPASASASRSAEDSGGSQPEATARAWRWAAAVVTLLGVAIVQTWFRGNNALASGDITPPNGTAWIGHMFDAWSTSNHGAPAADEGLMPWAGALRAVTNLGGSAELAQRLWITLLVASTLFAALWLLRLLDLRPASAAVGAMTYGVNPYVLTVVRFNAVYLASMTLLAALPAIVIAVGRQRLRARHGALLLVCSAPLLGYAYINPPLLLLTLLVTAASPLALWWLHGAPTATRAARFICWGLPVCALACLYWLVPAYEQLGGVAGNLSNTASWTWTEGRATLANAFWLNTAWDWQFAEYHPYAGGYNNFPLAVLRYLVPVLAFASVGVAGYASRRPASCDADQVVRLRLVSLVSGISLFVILLSTGTRAPGSVLFNALYSLPYGWLLREPGRFLMLAALGYAILVAVAFEWLSNWLLNHLPSAPLRASSLRMALGVALVGGAVLVPSYPLTVGAIAGDGRRLLPSSRVSVPEYWAQMARDVDMQPGSGSVLVMPPDDFYQMPYSWGYYGNDAFIKQMIDRAVIAPSGQSYFPLSDQLLNAVALTASAILDHRWSLVSGLLHSLNAPYVLVRGDITAFPSRTIVDPAALMAALQTSPSLRLVASEGPLRLYALRDGTLSGPSETTAKIASVNTSTPDLRVLDALAPGTSLVTMPARQGIPQVIQLPGFDMWLRSGDDLTTSWAATPGWSYTLAPLGDSPAAPSLTPATSTESRAPVAGDTSLTEQRSTGGGILLRTTVRLGRSLLVGNDDSSWSDVIDCRNLNPSAANLRKTLIHDGPIGQSVLRLAADHDSACSIRGVSWERGPVFLDLLFRHVSGAHPRICLLEVNLSQCAPLPDLGTGEGWIRYHGVVTPDPGTTSLELFVYADGAADAGSPTIAEYVDVHIRTVPYDHVDLLGSPVMTPAAGTPLVSVFRTAFSTSWTTDSDATHVLIDGLSNGWMSPSGDTVGAPAYGPQRVIEAAVLVSALTACLTFGLVLCAWRWNRHRRAQGASGRRSG